MDKYLREQAIKLRVEQSLSYSAIIKKLGVSKSTLSYWLKDLPLSHERVLELQKDGWSKSEVSRERFRETMRLKKVEKANKVYRQQVLTFNDLGTRDLFTAGLMLYQAEGDKNYYARIALSNTDARLIKFFIKWLEEFLSVSKREMRFQLHLYENMNISEEKDYWTNELKITESQLHKLSIRKLRQNSFSYKNSLKHGTCTMYAFGVERKTWLMMTIRAFLDRIT